ncbi:MAG: hypothetical protein HY752_00875 [Nitrospirae bacterium]|nr:hypothetical protein [Nitrospirota bacterium]
MRLFWLVFVAAILLGITVVSSEAGWLIYHKPAFKGKIIDIETREPIEGAVVVAIYYKYPIISGPAGGSSSIIDIREILTDKNGEFYIPPYTTIIQPLSEEDMANFIIYKPGYANIGELNLEGYFSGKETKDQEGTLFWNKELKFRLLANGVVELPKLMTWEERWKTNMISVSGDTPKSKWPLLNEAIENEEEWLKRNKDWRLK